MSTQAHSPAQSDAKAGPPPGQYLGPDGVSRLLARIAPPLPSSDPTDSSSLYLTPEALARWPESRDVALRDWHRFVSPVLNGPGGDALLKSDTGLVVLRRGEKGVALVPPFPIQQELISEEWDEAPLTRLLTRDYTVGVVMLRLGRYLVAVFRGAEPLVTKTDTRYVKGKHHAGGTSQLRFKRIREGQMRKLFDEACQVVGSRFEPHESELDYILLGGERLTLSGFLKVCPYLQRRQDLILGRRLNIRDPKHDTLETVSGMLRQSRVWHI
ncbi:MAG: Vms1/Ankzf1 family peptidyl-tRNA hydrolase [Chloroflexota bacterium]|nr:Vms1/Ankzf1 family peptidyl-tRNA hydrolase [Chloroflexota bacterium]